MRGRGEGVGTAMEEEAYELAKIRMTTVDVGLGAIAVARAIAMIAGISGSEDSPDSTGQVRRGRV